MPISFFSNPTPALKKNSKNVLLETYFCIKIRTGLAILGTHLFTGFT